jgi:hypothetical protein
VVTRASRYYSAPYITGEALYNMNNHRYLLLCLPQPSPTIKRKCRVTCVHGAGTLVGKAGKVHLRDCATLPLCLCAVLSEEGCGVQCRCSCQTNPNPTSQLSHPTAALSRAYTIKHYIATPYHIAIQHYTWHSINIRVRYDGTVDVYSFGMTLWSLATGEVPYEKVA